jgi:hypothetical protein
MFSGSEREEIGQGWLTAIADSKGVIDVVYSEELDATYPILRIRGTKPIIDNAFRMMQVNPTPRGDNGKLLGWDAEATQRKAVGPERNRVATLRPIEKMPRAHDPESVSPER